MLYASQPLFYIISSLIVLRRQYAARLFALADIAVVASFDTFRRHCHYDIFFATPLRFDSFD